VVLGDTQPGAGNCGLGPGSAVRVVIDHHPGPPVAAPAVVVDIRPTVGATATILLEYLQAAAMPIPCPLATALFYGIKTDTLGLIRGASDADVAAYVALVPHVDPVALMTIEQAPVPVAYFRQLYAAVQTAQVYEEVIIVNLGQLAYPDLTAELADLLLRLEGMRWSICLGVYEQQLLFSVRRRLAQGGAVTVAAAMVGDAGSAGGHGMLAGGQLPLQGRRVVEVAATLTQRVLMQLGKAATSAEPLVGDLGR